MSLSLLTIINFIWYNFDIIYPINNKIIYIRYEKWPKSDHKLIRLKTETNSEEVLE